VIYTTRDPISFPAVSSDGKRIAFGIGSTEWNVLEIALPGGTVRTVLGGGGISWWPDWAPSGTHFLVSTDRSGSQEIQDVSYTEGFSRRLATLPPDAAMMGSPRLSPEGLRFAFYVNSRGFRTLNVSSTSGGGVMTVDPDVGFRNGFSWSPDGQWLVYLTKNRRLARIKPSGQAVILEKATPAARDFDSVEWSPAGDWILYPVTTGLSLISPDGNTVQKLTSRRLLVYAFSKDGSHVFRVERNTTGSGAQWQLYSVEIASGREKLLASLDLPASTNDIAGLSLHPDGERFLTSIVKLPYDIWMLEGFEKHKTWLDRLLRR
jgi:Tol biopolymer transport system component